MITIRDNYLPESVFLKLRDYCDNNEFKVVETPNKSFLVLETPDILRDYLLLEGHDLVLTFIRKAHESFDTDPRIHADNIIKGRYIDYACVLYLNNENEVTKNGTCFWKHDIHGYKLPKETPDSEFNRLLEEDSNDYQKWEQQDLVYSRPNRLLMYDASLFHSKFPSKIEKGERLVLVAFFAKK